MRVELQQLETDECLSLEDVKLHCRIDIDADDDWVTDNIKAAREFIEQYIDGVTIPQRFTVWYDSKEVACFKSILLLPKRPLINVIDIKYYDSSNNETVFSTDNYVVSGDRIALLDTSYWPSSLRTFDGLSVEYVAGQGTYEEEDEEIIYTEEVPYGIKLAMAKFLAHQYENRGDAEGMNTLPKDIYDLLLAYRRFTL
jgi:uncharacterized phiE125 gp8 family phage protein